VTIIGSSATIQPVLNSGLADYLEVEIIPIFLQKGFRPFDLINSKIILKKKAIVEAGERTSLQYRIIKY
jgi:dihydrofolate reductase